MGGNAKKSCLYSAAPTSYYSFEYTSVTKGLSFSVLPPSKFISISVSISYLFLIAVSSLSANQAGYSQHCLSLYQLTPSCNCHPQGYTPAPFLVAGITHVNGYIKALNSASSESHSNCYTNLLRPAYIPLVFVLSYVGTLVQRLALPTTARSPASQTYECVWLCVFVVR